MTVQLTETDLMVLADEFATIAEETTAHGYSIDTDGDAVEVSLRYDTIAESEATNEDVEEETAAVDLEFSDGGDGNGEVLP